MLKGPDPSDYYLVTHEVGKPPVPWGWEICRRSAPMGVRLFEQGFRSKMAAEFSGRRALAEFLRALSQEAQKNRGDLIQVTQIRAIR